MLKTNHHLMDDVLSSRVLPRAVLIAIPLVILSYSIVNVAFFAVLSYDEIESAEAVGLVSSLWHALNSSTCLPFIW